MKVVYLTWGETPRASGVYGSQAIGQFASITRDIPKVQQHFIAGIPLINSGLTKEKFGYPNELNRVREKLNGIRFDIVWLPGIQTAFYSKRLDFWSFHFGADSSLAKKLTKINPDIVHCRSYHAAFAAINARKISGIPFKIVFDPRGLWPEEAALKGRVAYNSANYKFLKKIERKIIEAADTLVCVSDTMADHYKSLGAKSIQTIYLSASVSELASSVPARNNQIKTLICVGALANSTWHKPEMLRRVYGAFRQAYASTKLLIVTQSHHEDIRSVFGEFPSNEIEIQSTSNRKELSQLLARADFGVLPYFEPSTDYELQIAKTVIAVKTAEYLAAGVPVLVNEYCGGAAYLVKEWEVGLSYDPAKPSDVVNLLELSKLDGEITRARAKEVAFKHFDYAANSLQYANLYRKLLS